MAKNYATTGHSPSTAQSPGAKMKSAAAQAIAAAGRARLIGRPFANPRAASFRVASRAGLL